MNDNVARNFWVSKQLFANKYAIDFDVIYPGDLLCLKLVLVVPKWLKKEKKNQLLHV